MTDTGNNGINGNTQICDDSQACNYGSNGSCEFSEENYNCSGSWIGEYCGTSSACNFGSRADCIYPESNRVDCNGNPLYCDDSQACNYDGSNGSCEYPEENYNCSGSWIGEYCGTSSACNFGSRADCIYPESNNVDCDGNPLVLCDNSQAMNYGSAGSCQFQENTNTNTNTNTNININTIVNDYGISDTNGQTNVNTGDETGNNPNIAVPVAGNNDDYLNNMNISENNTNQNFYVDEQDNTITMSTNQLHYLINKVSDYHTSYRAYTSGEFKVNDRYYTTTGELLSHNSPEAPQIELIPGGNIIDRYEVKYDESDQPYMIYDDKTNTPYNYFYEQNIDPNVMYSYDTTEPPIKNPNNKYPYFETRYDRPIDFNGTSHTYMRPQNWRYPKKKAPKCKEDTQPNKPVYLDRNFTPLDNWDDHTHTILPKFTYEEF